MDNSQIYFSLGSNVGDRKSHIEHALKHLDSKLNINAISSIYETSPQGYEEQSNFYNLVCSTNNMINMYELLEICKDIEILRFVKDRLRRKHLPKMFSLIKNEN